MKTPVMRMSDITRHCSTVIDQSYTIHSLCDDSPIHVYEALHRVIFSSTPSGSPASRTSDTASRRPWQHMQSRSWCMLKKRRVPLPAVQPYNARTLANVVIFWEILDALTSPTSLSETFGRHIDGIKSTSTSDITYTFGSPHLQESS